MTDGPQVGLAMIDALVSEGRLDDYLYLHASRADLLRRLRRWSEAEAAYRRARALATNEAERRFLDRRLTEVANSSSAGEAHRPD
jgi:RNA polymerase sigma-70 factor (ECF subfamily)